MQIAITLPHVFYRGACPLENAYALNAALDFMVALNLAFLRFHPTPPLYETGVVYGRTVSWDTIGEVLRKGYGDCKSLATWLVAERRAAGLVAKPVFRWVKNAGGGHDFHILVQTPKGFEDPSKMLGMGQHENAPIQRIQ